MTRGREIDEMDEATWLRLWDEVYSKGGNDREAATVAGRWATESGDGKTATDDAWAMHWLWGGKWLDSGRAQLVLGHKYAAALMSSAVLENLGEDMIFPWKAFSLELPSGLLDFGELQYRRITVGIYQGLPFGCVLTLRGQRSGGGVAWFSRVAADAATLFFSKEADYISDIGKIADLDFKERAMQLSIRLVTGALYTIQHTDNFRSKEYANRLRGDGRRGPPPHRVYFVGKPMSLDCRPAVSHYLAGHKTSPPSVQSIVRGHYKRQVIGVGRSGRKVIWVEPYWRGPEEAPILSRPYQLGAPQ